MSLFCPQTEGSPCTLSCLNFSLLWCVTAWGEVLVLEARPSGVLMAVPPLVCFPTGRNRILYPETMPKRTLPGARNVLPSLRARSASCQPHLLRMPRECLPTHSGSS